jgi:hypothetical protein
VGALGRDGFDQVRIMREIYPPITRLSFACSRLIAGCSARLRDNCGIFGYLQSLFLPGGDPIRHDKGLVRPGMSLEFKHR